MCSSSTISNLFLTQNLNYIYVITDDFFLFELINFISICKGEEHFLLCQQIRSQLLWRNFREVLFLEAVKNSDLDIYLILHFQVSTNKNIF